MHSPGVKGFKNSRCGLGRLCTASRAIEDFGQVIQCMLPILDPTPNELVLDPNLVRLLSTCQSGL